MSEFDRSKIDMFLGAVRKYMQMRGPMSQKELAVITETGVSTMSRFLNQKTTDLNPQLIARIVAKLDIPLHEIIDFVEEEYADRFIRLVKFFKNEEGGEPEPHGPFEEMGEDDGFDSSDTRSGDEFTDSFSSLGTAKKDTKAQIYIGGKKRSIPFESDQTAKNSQLSIRDKLDALTPRQKAYLSDFLNLDMEGKDLMVDLGNSLFRYFRQKGMEL